MKQKYTPFQITLEILSFVAIVAVFAYLAVKWGAIPDKIPNHYNGLGQIDDWKPKNFILFLPVVNLFVYLLTTVFSFFPATWNVPNKVAAKDPAMAYKFGRDILVVTKFIVVVVFDMISYFQINVKPLGIWFLPLFIGVLLATSIYYIIQFRRVR